MKSNLITPRNKKINDFPMDRVKILDPYYINAFEKETAYLKEFEVERITAGFLENKGLEPKGVKYPGWESTEIRGHSLGHLLTALSQAYVNSKDNEILTKIKEIVDELEIAQFDSGYLSAFSEELFDNVENSKPAWVPWYTMHKIITGLLSVYQLIGYEKAKTIVSKLGDWVYNRTKGWSEEVHKRVLSIEYGGMNDCLYELYKITHSEKHLYAAHMFDELPLFTELREKHDILNGRHANTTIPKFLGALNRYLAIDKDEEFYLEASESFWDTVVNHHTYITGGNSEWEHFGEPDILEKERTNCNCETCNTYNMLKLSKELFKVTEDKKYADFYENTLVNAIMSSQNPDTGMTMYFQPMATGYFKVYGTGFDKFWCCTGTGMENFTKLNDSIYFHKEDQLYINQYVSSEVVWSENNIKLVQESKVPYSEETNFIIHTLDHKSTHGVLCLRVPNWMNGNMQVTINNNIEEINIIDGYIRLDRNWEDQDKITVITPITVSYEGLPDDKHSVAFRFGPVVLSAALGKEDMIESRTGVNVTVPTKYMYMKDYIIVKEVNIDIWLNNLVKNLVRNGDTLEFFLKGTDEDEHLIFTPHYKQHEERYGLYWNLVEEGSDKLEEIIRVRKEEDEKQRLIVDAFPVGNDQYELQHNVMGENTEAASFDGRNLRHAYVKDGKKGWFSYELKVDPSVNNNLVATYFSGNKGRTFDIYIDEELLIEETIGYEKENVFYDRVYKIPSSYVEGKEKITVKFVTRGDSFVGGLFDLLCVIRDKN
jgi:DUF1680 family protein